MREELTTLQAFGMKAPRWLQHQRAPPPPVAPLCAITGVPARYRDPLTGHFYASREAFRELRHRLGQPVPEARPRAPAGLSAALQALGVDGGAGAAAAGSSSGGGCFPPGQQQLQQLIELQVQQAAAAQKAGRGRGGGAYYQQQQAVPDEVAAMVLSVSQAVHGTS